MTTTPMLTAEHDRPDARMSGSAAGFTTTRHLGFEPAQVWSAMTQPSRLARWWGPEGHSNVFSLCDMRPGGQWLFDSMGPDRLRRTHRSIVESLEVQQGWVIRHIVPPLSRLSVRLTRAEGGGTRVDWCQQFDDEALARELRWKVMDANEQNLDRLNRELQTGW